MVYSRSGMPISKSTTATFALTDPEAKIGGTSYPTLDDALAAAADATIVLCKDITRDKPIVIDKSLTLDLNGRTLQRDLDAPVADGCVIRVEQSADLTVKDESTAKTGKITGGNNTGSGGGIYNRGTLILEGGAITDNKAEDGGGVYNYLGTFVMTGGAITANEAENGGGIYNRGTLNLSGGPSVQNNTQGNVYLPTGRKIQVTGALDAQAAIGIDMESPGAFTQGYPAGGADPDAYFTSDDGALSVRRSPDGGEAMLFAPYTLSTSGCQGAVTFMVNGAAATPDANGNLTLATDDAVLLSAAEAGFVLGAVSYTPESGEEVDVLSDANGAFGFAMPAADTDVSATLVDTRVRYLDKDGKEQFAVAREITALTPVTTSLTGWYYVKESVTFNDRIEAGKGFNLILCDGATLYAKKGIHVPAGSSLTIYA